MGTGYILSYDRRGVVIFRFLLMVNVTPHVYDVTNPNGKKITSNTLTVLTIFRHHLKYRFMCEPDKLYQGVVCYNSLQTF